MKLRQRIALMAGVLGLGVTSTVNTADAQIWAKYDATIENIFYNPLAGGTLIPDNRFLDFVGNADPDDGVANGIPVGFNFDYDGNMYWVSGPGSITNPAIVNVGINGWITVGAREIPVVTNDNNYLFLSNEPNNTVAPFWGDHYYRTLEPGYTPSRISYGTNYVPDPNPNATPGAVLGTFTVEWRDLNINNKANPNSIASFQVKIVQNPMANDLSNPQHRARIEFHYGPIGNLGQVTTDGASVGIEDSIGFTHMNGLFQSSFNDEQDTRLNTTARTSVWPPATGLPGRAIVFAPEGLSTDDWGDGDANLTQVTHPDPVVRNHQNRFVTLADADLILRSRAQAYPPLDSVEGRNAYHGDANHTGQYQNPNFPGINFYRVTSYDAAYILLYLAAKLPVLPWPEPLPVPAYKGSDANGTVISGVVADNANIRIAGSTLRMPIVLRGTVNGPLGIELNVASLNTNVLELANVSSVEGVSIAANLAEGMVALAAAGKFENGAVLGYLEFNIVSHGEAEVAFRNVMINDEMYADASTKVLAGAASVGSNVNGYSIEQNAPNPFVAGQDAYTTIAFTLGAQENVTLRVYDVLGNVVRTLAIDETFGQGPHSLKWDGRDSAGNIVANGMYYYQLTTSNFVETVKMQVVR